jgi:hypothetical protein
MSLATFMKGTGAALLGLASGKLMPASATKKADRSSPNKSLDYNWPMDKNGRNER